VLKCSLLYFGLIQVFWRKYCHARGPRKIKAPIRSHVR
jgi:hypothetical protein